MHPGVWPVSLAGAFLAGAALLHFVDPSEPGNYPTCPFLLLTGLQCPGCGTMRAIALLTHGDIVGALSMNLLLALFVPFLLSRYIRWTVTAFRPATPPGKPLATWIMWIMLGAILLFWGARNLPWFDFLAAGTPLLPAW